MKNNIGNFPISEFLASWETSKLDVELVHSFDRCWHPFRFDLHCSAERSPYRIRRGVCRFSRIYVVTRRQGCLWPVRHSSKCVPVQFRLPIRPLLQLQYTHHQNVGFRWILCQWFQLDFSFRSCNARVLLGIHFCLHLKEIFRSAKSVTTLEEIHASRNSYILLKYLESFTND